MPNTQLYPVLTDRKQEHITLALASQVLQSDTRFNYEPLFAHNWDKVDTSLHFTGLTLGFPLWVSSMTGGTAKAAIINERLAKACKLFKLGMGLGSCRPLLHSLDRFVDFNLRPLIGDQPLYANLGIAQLEELFETNNSAKIIELVKLLEANGLIIHLNPLQEWMQPEGDMYKKSPLETIKRVLDLVNFPIIVKEVGQGMGPRSIGELLQLPIAALDFGALGGTNFAKLELHRKENTFAGLEEVTKIGHTADEMMEFVKNEVELLGNKIACKQLIISGGIKNFLDGFYYIKKSPIPAIYAQASPFLVHALESEESLNTYISQQISGYALACNTLTIK